MTPPTVVVLTKAPIPGRCKTRLAPLVGLEQAALLHRAFTDATLELLRRTGLSVTVSVGGDPDGRFQQLLATRGWTVEAQPPGSLGDRMRSCLQSSGRRVFVGTDCVVFDPDWITAAATSVAPVAIAPSDDGGYWALSVDGGVPPSVLDDLFVDMPWSTPEVLPLTLRRCSLRGTPVELLPQSYDIDDPSDLSRLFHDSRCPAQLRSLLETLPCLS